jgi:acetoin utilization deacetylase AcuC-like enzyme
MRWDYTCPGCFKPEMIFVSAGFDANRDDGMTQFSLSEEDYTFHHRDCWKVCSRMHCVCAGRWLELHALGRSVAAYIKVLSGL